MYIGISCNFAVDNGAYSNHFKNLVYEHYSITEKTFVVFPVK
jgi:hypothetical protein